MMSMLSAFLTLVIAAAPTPEGSPAFRGSSTTTSPPGSPPAPRAGRRPGCTSTTTELEDLGPARIMSAGSAS